MFRDSYDWFLRHRGETAAAGASAHRSPARQGILRAAKHLLR